MFIKSRVYNWLFLVGNDNKITDIQVITDRTNNIIHDGEYPCVDVRCVIDYEYPDGEDDFSVYIENNPDFNDLCCNCWVEKECTLKRRLL